MIITCKECSTRFNLDESVLKPEGSKVRCSLCKHIFTVFPQGPAPPLVSDFEEEIEFDLPEETPPGESEPDDFETEGFETDDFETDDFDADKNDLAFESSDFEETEFQLDDLDFETKDDLESNEIGLEMESPGQEMANIEINFDHEPEPLETEDSLEFDEDDLIFDDSYNDAPDIAPEKSMDFDSMEQDSLALEIEDTPETMEDELEADLSFEDDPDADLIFEETDPEQEIVLEGDAENAIDDQNMSFPDLTMETDQETPPPESDQNLTPLPPLEEDPFESDDLEPDDLEPDTLELDGFDFQEEPDLPDSEIQFEEKTPEAGDDFSAYDQVLDQDTEPENTFPTSDPVTPIETEKPATTLESPREELIQPELSPPTSRRRTKRSAMASPIMLLGLIFILVAGAYIASMTLGYKIPYLSDVKIPILENFFKKESPKKVEPKPIPNEVSVNGRFLSNDTAGELFIITGQITNPATIPYSHIQIKGTLITKGKVKAQTLVVFCGNIISEEILKSGNISDIYKQLGIKEGDHNSNVNVKPGGFVPFMLVFSNLPDNLENFTIEVVE